jgi:NitT/TauT family transport system substrate-binding protein
MRAIYGALACAFGLLACIAGAHAQQNLDTFRIAIGGFGLWAAEAPRLGQQAGIFKKHGVNVEYYATAGAGESLQAVISGSADLSIAVGTTGVMGAFAKGAPVRIIGANFTGASDLYWYARADSPIRSLKDASDKAILGFSSNGSSSNTIAVALVEETGAKMKLLAAGDQASTFTQVMSGQIDLGWAAPPFGLKDIAEGKIRIVATGNDAPSLRDQTVRVDIASVKVMTERKEALARYVKAYRETLDWMYADPQAIEMWAANISVPVEYARKAAFDFQPKAARDFDTITGLDKLMEGAVRQKFLSAPLTTEQLSTLIQIVK